MNIQENVEKVQRALEDQQIDAWLLYTFRDSNPIFKEVVGKRATTRRAFLYIPKSGDYKVVVHNVDAGRFSDVPTQVYSNREDMVHQLQDILKSVKSVAMEYSPFGAIPTMSLVDAGTIELIRTLGVEVVPSADLYQEVFAFWTENDVKSHMDAGQKLIEIKNEAFRFISLRLGRVEEHEVLRFIRDRYQEHNLISEDGPVVAVNENSGDPHYEPQEESRIIIKRGDWVLIDMWARHRGGAYADITWVGYVGESVPEKYVKVFNVVAGARDRALNFLSEAYNRKETLEGWQVDEIARNYIESQGYGPEFAHRLGHSLGHEVHGRGVNLDNFETKDTRKILKGIGFTVEPGIYLPEFGVRLENDVYFGEKGPVLTTPAQKEILKILPF